MEKEDLKLIINAIESGKYLAFFSRKGAGQENTRKCMIFPEVNCNTFQNLL